MKRIELVFLALLLAGCASQAGGALNPTGVTATATVASTPEPTLAPTPTPEPTPVPTPTATPTPAGPQTYAVGEPVYLTQKGDVSLPWGIITISDVATAASYKGSYGYLEKPQQAGDVFISARVTYEAKVDGIHYNPYDWQVFVDGTAVSSTAFVLYGPKPALSSGSLPNGRKATGFVVYEVPAKGEVRMSYGSSFSSEPPIFEVVIRAA
jgi:hypothetical protein